MVEYICLAEFDIDKGSSVRIQYPDTVPHISTEDLAEYMITEGAHNFSVVSTYFTVGKRPCRELLAEQNRMIVSPQSVMLDKIFDYDKRQKLMEGFWLPEDHHFVPGQVQPAPTRALSDSIRNQTLTQEAVAAQSELRYVAQKVKLYRIENLQWKSYFQQGRERLVEFQLTVYNRQNFTIKLIADPSDSAQPLTAVAAQDSFRGKMVPTAATATSGANPFCIEIKVHPFLNFKARPEQPHRAQFQNVHGYTYGIEIVNEVVEERLDLFKMMKSGLEFDPYQQFEYNLSQNRETVFFLNVLCNRKEQAVKRGAIVKALAFGTKNKALLEPLSQLIEVTLDSILKVTDLTASAEVNQVKYRQIIVSVFASVNANAGQMLLGRGNFLERAVSIDYNTNCCKNNMDNSQNPLSLYQTHEIAIDHHPDLHLRTKVILPLASPPDQVSQVSLIRFVNLMGKNTMLLYDAILSDKRIIFASSRNLSLSQIQNFLYAAASMVAPLYGIFNKIWPFVPLAQMSTLEGSDEGGFLAGVTNPMFIENRRCYDVSIQIDEAKLNADSSYKREAYFELDQEFIKTLLVRIRQDKISDEEVRQAFHSYTLLMLDLATSLVQYGGGGTQAASDTAGLTHNRNPLSQQYLSRTRRLKNTHLFKVHLSLLKMMDQDMTYGISLANITQHLRTLRIKGLPSGALKETEALTIFKELELFVEDEQSAIKLLYITPLCRQGVGLIAHGLFYDHERIQFLAAKILLKLKKAGGVGELAVGRLSEFFKMRLFDVVQDMQEQGQLPAELCLQ